MFEKNIEKIVNSAVIGIEDKIKSKLETPDLGIPEIGIAGLVSLIQTIITKLSSKKIISDDLIESILDLLEKRLNEKIEKMLANISDILVDIFFEILEKISIKLKESKNQDLMGDIILTMIKIIPKLFNNIIKTECSNLRELDLFKFLN